MPFNRGDQVRYYGDRFHEEDGTVTHLHGDPPDETHPDGWDSSMTDEEEVWVTFYNGREFWADTDYLVHR